MGNWSEQQLEAFVDGQMDAADRAKIIVAMDYSADIRQRVSDLRRLKDIVQLAYNEESSRPHFSNVMPSRAKGLTIAASMGALVMFIVISLFNNAAWFAFSAPGKLAGNSVEAIEMALPGSGKTEQVLFHVTTNDFIETDNLLDQVELVANEYRQLKKPLRIIVVTNNEGLRLFQVNQSSHIARLRDIYRRYDNVTFAACGVTLGRFTTSGEARRPELLPEAIVVDSGVAEIERRQSQGWKYIRI